MSGLKDRRDFLKHAGLMGSVAMMASMPEGALALGGMHGSVIEDAVIAPAVQAAETPQHHIKFAVCGMSHDHIYGMIGAVQRGGGELVAAWGGEEDKLDAFKKRFPDVKIVKTQEEVINDPQVQLVLTSQIANERAGIFICDVMGHGVRSALVTAILRALVEELTPEANDPGELLAKTAGCAGHEDP